MPARQVTAEAIDIRNLIPALAILVNFGAIGAIEGHSFIAPASADQTGNGGLHRVPVGNGPEMAEVGAGT
jgi:hypothetical protein